MGNIRVITASEARSRDLFINIHVNIYVVGEMSIN